MRLITAGAVAGLIGGALMTAAMVGGRRAGVLDKTLAEESEDWLDKKFHTREAVGDLGTTAIEQADHMLSATAFGIAYAKLRSYLGALPWPVAGALYGTGLYVVNIVGVAPLLGITRGEWQAPARVVGQRLGMHVLFGTATAAAYELLAHKTNGRADTHERSELGRRGATRGELEGRAAAHEPGELEQGAAAHEPGELEHRAAAAREPGELEHRAAAQERSEAEETHCS